MNLAGYRTILVNALLLIAGLAGRQISPEVIEQHLNLAFTLFAAVNIFMRILTKGPVGPMIQQMLPQTAAFKKVEAIWEAIDWRTGPSLDSATAFSPSIVPMPAPDVPAQTDPDQGDVVAMLPIYAVKLAEAVNQTLSETIKAN